MLGWFNRRSRVISTAHWKPAESVDLFTFWPGGFGGSYFYRSYYLISVKHHKAKISKDTDCASLIHWNMTILTVRQLWNRWSYRLLWLLRKIKTCVVLNQNHRIDILDHQFHFPSECLLKLTISLCRCIVTDILIPIP
jgi:hypothetical protein